MNAFTHLRRRVPTISNVVRSYAREPFTMKWVRPEVPSCFSKEKSGDLGLDYKIDPNEPCQLFKNVPEIESCDENVKKLLSLKYNPGKETIKLKNEKAISLVQSAENVMSVEVLIAKLTSEIHYLQDYMKQNPRNKIVKVALKEKIEKRRKYLSKLRLWDYKRFEWILEQLNLVFKPAPEEYMQVTRRDSIQRLAKMHCKSIIQEKLDNYRMELKSQQKDFFEKKAKQLAFIREEEIFCGLEPTITDEEIEEAKSKAAAL